MIHLLSHKDSGNRGCEAITRGTMQILGLDKKDVVAYTNDYALDSSLGLDRIVILKTMCSSADVTSFFFRLRRKIYRKFNKEKSFIYSNEYKKVLRSIKPDDIELSTGGDMFCYDNNEVIYINDVLHKKGVKTMLWGCSVGKENLTPEKIATLKKFSKIMARESLTVEALSPVVGSDKVSLVPDPAFVLNSEECELPEYFSGSGDCIGLNLSNFVGDDVSFSSLFTRNICRLIDYVISESSMDIVLIPHVFWKDQDDRIVCRMIEEKYSRTGRVHYLDTEKLGYCQIRYIIGKCRFFLGARTHAMISAYSMAVPAIALGYSIKSRGIARDLGLDPQLVVNCKNLSGEDDILKAFLYLQSNEEKTSDIYRKNLEQYRQKAYDAKNEFLKLEV